MITVAPRVRLLARSRTWGGARMAAGLHHDEVAGAGLGAKLIAELRQSKCHLIDGRPWSSPSRGGDFGRRPIGGTGNNPRRASSKLSG